MADAMEAILAAVYFDGGIAAVKTVTSNLGLVPTQANLHDMETDPPDSINPPKAT